MYAYADMSGFGLRELVPFDDVITFAKACACADMVLFRVGFFLCRCDLVRIGLPGCLGNSNRGNL